MTINPPYQNDIYFFLSKTHRLFFFFSGECKEDSYNCGVATFQTTLE